MRPPDRDDDPRARLADPARLWALVRSQRVALFVAGLITTEEAIVLLDDDDRASALAAAPIGDPQ